MTPLLLAATVAMAPPPVPGDFDRDGRMDVAEVVGGADGAYRLRVRREGEELAYAEIAAFKDLANLYVVLQPPGVERTWCGKGGGAKNAPCDRATVRLQGDTLAFGTKEASRLAAIWNGAGFDIVALSD